MTAFIICAEILIICFAGYLLANAIGKMVGTFSATDTTFSIKLISILVVALPTIYFAIMFLIEIFTVINSRLMRNIAWSNETIILLVVLFIIALTAVYILTPSLAKKFVAGKPISTKKVMFVAFAVTIFPLAFLLFHLLQRK